MRYTGVMVFSGHTNSITESHFIRSTDCTHVALANLLFESIIVQGRCVINAYIVFA